MGEKEKDEELVKPLPTYAQTLYGVNRLDPMMLNPEAAKQTEGNATSATSVNNTESDKQKMVLDNLNKELNRTDDGTYKGKGVSLDEWQKSGAQWEKDYYDSIWSKEDEEAAEKKKKAAQWITAAQMLGDSLSALGNSYFTAKGANSMGASQGVPKAAEATHKLSADIKAAQERAAKTRYEIEKAREAFEYQKEQGELARKERKEAADRAQANADRIYELQKNQFEYQMQKDETTRNDAMTKWLKEFDLSEKGAETAAISAQTSATNATTAALRAKTEADKFNQMYNSVEPFNLGGTIVEIPTDVWNNSYQAIYASLPDDVKKHYETRYKNELGTNSSTSQAAKDAMMKAAVLAEMRRPEVALAVAELAGNKDLVANYEKIIADTNKKSETAESTLVTQAKAALKVVDDSTLKAAIQSGDEGRILDAYTTLVGSKKYEKAKKKADKANAEAELENDQDNIPPSMRTK